jgi:hypothetical protein
MSYCIGVPTDEHNNAKLWTLYVKEYDFNQTMLIGYLFQRPNFYEYMHYIIVKIPLINIYKNGSLE